MKAKPTVYMNTRFRSRLEAKWARFFDAIYEPWEYEPEIPETAGEYLPDFWLPRRRAVIEIKPFIAGRSEPTALLDDHWDDQFEFYRRTCNGDRQFFAIFGEPGKWGNGRLIDSGHEALHLYFTGSMDFSFNYQFGECPRCGNVWLFEAGFPTCCRIWEAGTLLTNALNLVRDHTYESA